MNEVFIQIEDQEHKMWAEGDSEKEITEDHIKEYCKNKGFSISGFETFYDEMFKVYKFICNIEKIK